MYNNQYEEYMRNSLGYGSMPMMNMNQMNSNTMNEMYESENNFSCNQAVDNMYPEIYKIIYPMVCKACMAVNENISEDLVSRIVNEIYVNVESTEVVETTRETRSSTQTVSSQANKISRNDLPNSTRTNTTSISSFGSSNSKTGSNLTSNTSSNEVAVNTRQQEKRQGNPLLRDLIRILVLRELLGNPTRPQRPPHRPPFMGETGIGGRPPFMQF